MQNKAIFIAKPSLHFIRSNCLKHSKRIFKSHSQNADFLTVFVFFHL